jgi:outer membrane protein TolC
MSDWIAVQDTLREIKATQGGIKTQLDNLFAKEDATIAELARTNTELAETRTELARTNAALADAVAAILENQLHPPQIPTSAAWQVGIPKEE